MDAALAGTLPAAAPGSSAAQYDAAAAAAMPTGPGSQQQQQQQAEGLAGEDGAVPGEPPKKVCVNRQSSNRVLQARLLGTHLFVYVVPILPSLHSHLVPLQVVICVRACNTLSLPWL